MPDISMCTGERAGDQCPLVNTCYRHLAKPSPYRQSYFAVAPFIGTHCEHYWPTPVEPTKETP